MFGRVSGFFIKGNTVYAIDLESVRSNHPNWRDGVRIGPVDEVFGVTGFIPPFTVKTASTRARPAKASRPTPTGIPTPPKGRTR